MEGFHLDAQERILIELDGAAGGSQPYMTPGTRPLRAGGGSHPCPATAGNAVTSFHSISRKEGAATSALRGSVKY